VPAGSELRLDVTDDAGLGEQVAAECLFLVERRGLLGVRGVRPGGKPH